MAVRWDNELDGKPHKPQLAESADISGVRWYLYGQREGNWGTLHTAQKLVHWLWGVHYMAHGNCSSLYVP